jgi:hypothetical protein
MSSLGVPLRVASEWEAPETEAVFGPIAEHLRGQVNFGAEEITEKALAKATAVSKQDFATCRWPPACMRGFFFVDGAS